MSLGREDIRRVCRVSSFLLTGGRDDGGVKDEGGKGANVREKDVEDKGGWRFWFDKISVMINRLEK